MPVEILRDLNTPRAMVERVCVSEHYVGSMHSCSSSPGAAFVTADHHLAHMTSSSQHETITDALSLDEWVEYTLGAKEFYEDPPDESDSWCVGTGATVDPSTPPQSSVRFIHVGTFAFYFFVLCRTENG